jgi:hypothetical protein
MGSSQGPLYADTPLALLTTPAFETGKLSRNPEPTFGNKPLNSGQKDPLALEASHMTLSHNSFTRGYNDIYQQDMHLTRISYLPHRS